MSMKQEEMCALIQTGERADLIPALWESVQRLYTLKALRYYHRNTERCKACGIEPEDIQQQAFFAFLRSIDEYKPEKGLPFTAFIDFPFRLAMQELLCYRTASSKHDALNLAESLDKEIDTADGSGGTLADFIPDTHSLDFLEQLDAQSVAAMIRAEVDALPDRQRLVIVLIYFDGRTLEQTAAEIGTSTERARQIRKEALCKLAQRRNLAELHRVFYHSEQLRELEAESKHSIEAERRYYEMVDSIRANGRDIAIFAAEQAALLLNAPGAACNSSGT